MCGRKCQASASKIKFIHWQFLSLSLSLPHAFLLHLDLLSCFLRMKNALIMNKSGMQSGKHFLPNSHDLVGCLFPWEWKPAFQFGLCKCNCGYFYFWYKWLIKSLLAFAVSPSYKIWVRFTHIITTKNECDWKLIGQQISKAELPPVWLDSRLNLFHLK